MSRSSTSFGCTECGEALSRWVGRCPGCGSWGTLADTASGKGGRGAGAGPTPIGQVSGGEWQPRPTGVGELDRVLGGGLVVGSVTLLGGEPGVGKSTLILQALARLAGNGHRCLLVTGEESPHQVRLRAERLETLAPELWLVAEAELPRMLAHVDQVEPAFLVVDSIQTVVDPEVQAPPGSVAQVRACAHRLVRLAKEKGVTTVLVGHVTKDGTLAGPRVLEHLVDTVLSFTGDRHHALRMLRATKHRFGPTTELGLFEMSEAGLGAVPDAGRLFLSDRRTGVPGSVVVAALDGHRPLLVELQALVAPASGPPRRSAQGLESGRLALLLAVLERRVGVRVAASDVYALAVGGVRICDPGADLAVALAVASAVADRPVPADLVACGEVGLAGELRQVPQTARRLAEAARLGFRRALVPASAPEAPEGITVLRASTLSEALDSVGLLSGRGIGDRRESGLISTN
ncbi:MAG: DNA repair protein RadA [Acidimicrobiales bacterium]